VRWTESCGGIIVAVFAYQFITYENQIHSIADRCCSCIPIMPPGHEPLRGSQQPEGKDVQGYKITLL